MEHMEYIQHCTRHVTLIYDMDLIWTPLPHSLYEA